jgi:hypothetical protein
MTIEQNAPDLFLCSALLELAGNIFLYRTHVHAALQSGATLIEESYGFKHVLKNVLMILRSAPPGSPFQRVALDHLASATRAFGTLLLPTHGYWIDTDPQLALRWRLAGADGITTFEDYGLVGERGSSSFLALQSDCRRFFAQAAAEWRWQRIEMQDRSVEENTRHALAVIEGDVLGNR